jgi:hypothetical protein
LEQAACKYPPYARLPQVGTSVSSGSSATAKRVLRTIIHLGERGEGERCGGLIRRAVDELIWLSYLEEIKVKFKPDGEHFRDQLLQYKITEEVCNLVHAQLRACRVDQMSEWGFSAQFLEITKSREEQNKPLAPLLRKALGWENWFPSPGWLASEVGLREMYELIYAATSATVHFSPVALLRWSVPHPGTRLSQISDQVMAPFWIKFAIFWSCQILYDSSHVVADAFRDHPINELLEQNFELVAATFHILSERVGRFPIISREEFEERFPMGSDLTM